MVRHNNHESFVSGGESLTTINQIFAELKLPKRYLMQTREEVERLVTATVAVSQLAHAALQEVQNGQSSFQRTAMLETFRSEIRDELQVEELERLFVEKYSQVYDDPETAIKFTDTVRSVVPATIEKQTGALHAAFAQSDLQKVSAAANSLNILGFDVFVPHEATAEAVVPQVVSKPNKGTKAAAATAATVGVLVASIALGASPAAAAEAQPSATQSTSETQPASSQPETEEPTVDSSQVAPTPSDTPTIEPPQTETPPVEAPVENTPVDYAIEVAPESQPEAPKFTKQETDPVISEISPEQDPVVAVPEQDQTTNNELDAIVEKLDPEFADVYASMLKAQKSGDLAAFNSETVFNPVNPYDKKDHLALIMSAKARASLAANITILQKILSGDQKTVDDVINDTSIQIDDAYTDVLVEIIQNSDFIEGTEGLEIDERIAFVKQLIATRDELVPEAERVTKIELEKIEKGERTKNAAQVKNASKSKYDQYIATVLATPEYEGLENYELSQAELDVIDSQKFSAQQKAFIKKVYPIFIRYQDKYQYNALIAMSMVVQENNIDPDNDLFKVAHNILSIKAPRDYDGPVFLAPTWEQYDGSGTITKLDDVRWIKFESDEACIKYFVEHTLGLSAYDDARKFYKSPELFLMGLLNKMQNDGDVQDGHHLGATAYATALEYAYGVPAIAAQRGFDKIGPENYRVGYSWNAVTTDGNPIPTSLRGGAFYHVNNAKYEKEIGADKTATYYDSVAMVMSQFGESNTNPVQVKDITNNAKTLPEVLKPLNGRGLDYRTLKLSSSSFEKALNAGGTQIIVEGKDGAYVLDMATVGNKKQGFFVLDPTSTITSTEPWSYAELKQKLGIKTAYVVGTKIYGETPKVTKPKSEPKKEKGSQFPAFLEDGTPYVSQWDNRWANEQYDKANGEHKTIASSGCSPTTAAFILRDTGGRATSSPIPIARANQKNGGRESSREAFREFAKTYDYKFVDISNLSTKEQIRLITEARKINPKTNRPYGSVVASGQDPSPSDPAPFTSGGHVLAITKMNKKGSSKVMDPNSLRKSKVWWSSNQLLERASYVYVLYPN